MAADRWARHFVADDSGSWCLYDAAWPTGAGGIGQGVVFLAGTSLILAGVVRFVENQFAEEKTTAEIRRIFGEVKNVEYRPMGLRAIFLAMARKGNEA